MEKIKDFFNSAAKDCGLIEQKELVYAKEYAINKKTALSVEKVRLDIKLRGSLITYTIRLVNNLNQKRKTLSRSTTTVANEATLNDVTSVVYKVASAAHELATVYSRL